VEASQEGPLLILRHGKPAALLIGLEAFEELLDRLQFKAELERRETCTSFSSLALPFPCLYLTDLTRSYQRLRHRQTAFKGAIS